MRKIVFDTERCILHNTVELLKKNDTLLHATTPGHKTGNLEIERLHGTLYYNKKHDKKLKN